MSRINEDLQAKIIALTGLSDRELLAMRLEEGCRFVELYFSVSESVRELEWCDLNAQKQQIYKQSPLYWNWWHNQWNLRDEELLRIKHFLFDCDDDNILIYKINNSAECLYQTSPTHPIHLSFAALPVLRIKGLAELLNKVEQVGEE